MDEFSKVDSMDETWKDRGKEGWMMNEWMNSVKLTVWMNHERIEGRKDEWWMNGWIE